MCTTHWLNLLCDTGILLSRHIIDPIFRDIALATSCAFAAHSSILRLSHLELGHRARGHSGLMTERGHPLAHVALAMAAKGAPWHHQELLDLGTAPCISARRRWLRAGAWQAGRGSAREVTRSDARAS